MWEGKVISVIKSLNLAVAFLLELGMVAAFGYWGFNTPNETLLKVIVGIGLPLLSILIWGIFMAPRSGRQLTRNPRVILQTVLFGGAALAWATAGQQTLALVFLIIAVVSVTLAYIWHQ